MVLWSSVKLVPQPLRTPTPTYPYVAKLTARAPPVPGGFFLYASTRLTRPTAVADRCVHSRGASAMPGRLLLHLLFIAALLAGSVSARGEDYPSHPIRLIVTTPAGSLVDVLGRMFAEDLGTRLGQNLFVDNRPGGMTQIGVDALNRAPRDGYTLMIGTSEATMLPFLKRTYRYDPLHDFTPIALLTTP